MKNLILNGIPFSPAMGASGVQGTFDLNKEYKHKKFMHALIPGYSFNGMTKVFKTFTAYKNIGKTPLADDGYSVRDLFPKSVKIYPIQNAVLNAFGLSNPGLNALLDEGIWQELSEPFFVSFMPVASTKEKRMEETKYVAKTLSYVKFKVPIGFQVNVSCPNTEHNRNEFLDEVFDFVCILSNYLPGVPLIVKISVDARPEEGLQIMNMENVHGLCFSNTVKWYTHTDKIKWWKFAPFSLGKISPLQKKVGAPGGLSGAPIFPLVYEWLQKFNDLNPTKPVIVSGGVTSKDRIRLFKAIPCVKAISIGSIASTRPWRVQGLINEILKD